MSKDYEQLIEEFKKCNREGMIKRYCVLLLVFELYQDLVKGIEKQVLNGDT